MRVQVIFMFGEIDCREGLLLAVDKLKYKDVQEAMDVLADIYMEVLTQTANKRGLRVFVHPVPPVLNETRHIVNPFNDLMGQRVSYAFQNFYECVLLGSHPDCISHLTSLSSAGSSS